MNNAITKAIESLKYHPDASHVEPNERDAWNRALNRALKQINTLVLGKPVAWYRDPSPLEPYGDDAEGEAVYGHENPNMPGLDEGWQPAYSAMASLIEVPVKLDIPPPGSDSHDVAYAEGWNAACEAFFQGKPAPEPLVITVTKTEQPKSSDTAVCWVNPETLQWKMQTTESLMKVTRKEQARYGFTLPLFAAAKAVVPGDANNIFPVTFEKVAEGIEVGYDIFGGADIRLGGDFVYVHVNYDYRYTSNHARTVFTDQIVELIQGKGQKKQEQPVQTDIAKALSLVGAYRPCEHVNADTRLGDGSTWAKCEDCGAEFKQHNWQRARDNAADFDEAMALLSAVAEKPTTTPDDFIPRGFEVKHNPNDPGATQAWNDANRFTVRRLETPYATETGKKRWSAPKLSEAMDAACADLGVSREADGLKDAK